MRKHDNLLCIKHIDVPHTFELPALAVNGIGTLEGFLAEIK